MMLHDALALMVAFLCVYVTIAPEVKTGVVGTAGLAVMSLGALWSIDDMHDPYAATDWILTGFLLVAGHVTLRVIRSHVRRRRDPSRPATDWGVLGEQERTTRRAELGGN